MNQQQALEILINGIKVAQKRGAFELEEATLLGEAVRVFIPKETVKQPEPSNNSDDSTEG